MLYVGRAAVCVDIVTVGRIVHHMGFCTEGVKNAFSNLPCCTVGDIQTDFDVFEAVFAHGNQVADVAVAAFNVVDCSADVLSFGNGDLKLAVDVVFYLEQGFFRHLFAVAVEQLDAIVIKRVVGCGNHDTAVEIVDARNIGNGGGGGNVHDIRVRAACHQARTQGIFEHIGGAAGVLADQNLCFFVHVGAVVPTQKASDLDSVFEC